MATVTNSDPTAGSPEWWLHILLTDLFARLPALKRRGRYVEGKFDDPVGDRDYMRAYGHLAQLANINFCGLVTQAKVQRMEVRGFQFGNSKQKLASQPQTTTGPLGQPGQQPPPDSPPTSQPQPTQTGAPTQPDQSQLQPGVSPQDQPPGDIGGLDPDANDIWQFNDMDMQATKIHEWAAKYGLAYGLVEPADPDVPEGLPIITAQDPRQVITYRDPRHPMKCLAALRLWSDDLYGHVLAVLYTEDQIYAFQGPDITVVAGLTLEQTRDTLLGLNGGPGSFGEPVESTINELEEVPVVEYVWRPNSGPLPEGEVGFDVRAAQDRANQTVFDRVSISLSQAYKQRYVSGVKLQDKKNGGKKAPFDPGAHKLWVVTDEKAKFGEFGSADLTQILEAIDGDMSHIAAITQTPAYYFMGKMANISGETLAQADTSLVKGVKQRMKSMGWSHERLMKLAFAYCGNEKATQNATVIWLDPESNALTDQAAALAQMVSSGVPLHVGMERVGGFTEDQIATAAQAAADQKVQDAQMQQQQMELAATQQDHQQGMDQAGHQLAAKTQADTAKVQTIQAQAAMKKASQNPGNPRTASNGGGNPRPKKSKVKPAR